MPTISHPCLCSKVGGPCLRPLSPLFRGRARGGWTVCELFYSLMWLVIYACLLLSMSTMAMLLSLLLHYAFVYEVLLLSTYVCFFIRLLQR